MAKAMKLSKEERLAIKARRKEVDAARKLKRQMERQVEKARKRETDQLVDLKKLQRKALRAAMKAAAADYTSNRVDSGETQLDKLLAKKAKNTQWIQALNQSVNSQLKLLREIERQSSVFADQVALADENQKAA